jgi:VanZ family protein
MQRKPLHTALFIIIAILSILFFVGGPDYYSTRSFKAFWNLGHIVYYALLPIALFALTRKKPRTLRVQITIILIVTLLLGIIVELFQANFNRTPDVGDLFRNMIGAAFGIAFILPDRKTIPKRTLRILQTITIILVATQIYPIAAALTDEYQAHSQFPVLADFENPFERQRWTGGAVMTIDDTIAHTGKHSLRVSLDTTLYSGVSLNYFPGDWTGFTRFQFSVYNPSPEPLTITCRIHDLAHTQGIQRYEDRYNHTFTLTQGWNTITIELGDVKNAPANRPMDMHHIRGIGLFATHLPHPRTINIDTLNLN